MMSSSVFVRDSCEPKISTTTKKQNERNMKSHFIWHKSMQSICLSLLSFHLLSILCHSFAVFLFLFHYMCWQFDQKSLCIWEAAETKTFIRQCKKLKKSVQQNNETKRENERKKERERERAKGKCLMKWRQKGISETNFHVWCSKTFQAHMEYR